MDGDKLDSPCLLFLDPKGFSPQDTLSVDILFHLLKGKEVDTDEVMATGTFNECS